MAENLRLRLVFEDPHMLGKPQKKEGLKRSWVLLKPCHHTIYDLSLHILNVFQLEDSCPHGLILSMDGFVLPPFESTCILKDKDIISVKRREKSSALLKSGGEKISSKKLALVVKNPEHTGVKLLANKEFQEEIGGYESESEDDEGDQLENSLQMTETPSNNKLSKKRKKSEKLSNSKRKKNKHASTEEYSTVPNGEQKESIINSCEDNVSKKKRKIKENDLSSDVSKELTKSSKPEVTEKGDDSSESTSSEKRASQPTANVKDTANTSQTTAETKKGPSRNARRKKAKRRWLREMAKAGNRESQQNKLLKDNDPSLGNEISGTSKECQQTDPRNDVCKEPCQTEALPNGNTKLPEEVQQSDHDSDEGDEVVPVVIRPGHIRFEPLGKDRSMEQNQASVETFQWNGITSKKKGQKWGTEKATSSKRTDYRSFSQRSIDMSSDEELTTEETQIDFEKLASCDGLPNVGDVIAYRLIELSSTWTPEISPFRVGEVSQFDKATNQVTLKPVPEYPIVFEEKVDEEGSNIQPDTSLYAEDGSLEIDYSSLIEVRIVRPANVNIAATGTANEDSLVYQNAAADQIDKAKERTKIPCHEHGKVNGWESTQPVETKEAHHKVNELEGSSTPVSCSERPQMRTINRELSSQSLSTNQQVNGWEEIAKALNAKKAQLSQKENSGKKEGSRRGSLPYKAWRGSALGPTMALLRAENQL